MLVAVVGDVAAVEGVRAVVVVAAAACAVPMQPANVTAATAVASTRSGRGATVVECVYGAAIFFLLDGSASNVLRVRCCCLFGDGVLCCVEMVLERRWGKKGESGGFDLILAVRRSKVVIRLVTDTCNNNITTR